MVINRAARQARVMTLSAVGLAAWAMIGCAAFYPPLEVVDYVEPQRYVGKWYEIARYPVWFERGCVGVTADYELREDGRIDVLNTCREGELDGPVRTADAVARIVDEETNAKLKVTFFWPFAGDYWIIGVDEEYEWAVVGEPSRQTLWILAREPQLQEEVLNGILAMLPEKGYEPSMLYMTPQPPA